MNTNEYMTFKPINEGLLVTADEMKIVLKLEDLLHAAEILENLEQIENGHGGKVKSGVEIRNHLNHIELNQMDHLGMQRMVDIPKSQINLLIANFKQRIAELNQR